MSWLEVIGTTIINFFRRDPQLCGTERSEEWPRVRAEHLAVEPHCVVCGSKGTVEVHHIFPFHLYPEKELDPANLITLCRKSGCHWIFGHLCSWASHNKTCREDAMEWLFKIRNRP